MTLHAADEGLHSPPASAPAKWQENFFFICWDPEAGHGFLMHVQRVPGINLQEAQVVVSVDGELASATFAAPFHPAALPAQVAMRATDPFVRWRLEVEGLGHPGRGPLGFLATRPAGGLLLAADLTLESPLPVADLAQGLTDIVAGLRPDGRGPQMAPQEHYEQGGIWRGRLRIGDRSVVASGLFVRDHSWGVRNEQRFCAFWTASCLDGGRLFTNAIGIPAGERVVGVGVVVDEAGPVFTSEVGASFTPTAGLHGYAQATIDFGAGISRTMRTRTVTHIPIHLPHSGPRRYDNNAISTVEMDEKAGFGVIEWADVLTENESAQLEPSSAPEEVRS
ncbi:MAG: hypothetical protein ACRDZ3_00685 [Acidimicrobiia bacterium]